MKSEEVVAEIRSYCEQTTELSTIRTVLRRHPDLLERFEVELNAQSDQMEKIDAQMFLKLRIGDEQVFSRARAELWGVLKSLMAQKDALSVKNLTRILEGVEKKFGNISLLILTNYQLF